MGLAESVFGSPGTTDYIKSGGSQASPGYNFAQQFYNWLPQLMQQQYPTYQGQLDPGMSPTMQDAIRRSQGYAQSGPSEILQGVQGTLGQFMSPSFINPWNAMTTQPPNYGGYGMDTRAYGGKPIGSYGGYGGSPGMGVPPGQGMPPLGGGQMSSWGSPGGGGGQGFAAGEPTPGGGNPNAAPMLGGGMRRPEVPPLGSGFPTPGGGTDAQNPNTPFPGGGMPQPMPPQQGGAGGFQSALGMGFGDAQKALAQQFQGNRQGLNSALAGQYGMNQYGQQNDGRQQFMHSTDHVSALQRTLGREPTFDEVQQSLRSGPGAIEQARSLFQQDDPNGRANWGQGQSDYGKLVDQYGLAKGGQMFQQQFGNGPMWAGGRPGAAPTTPPLGGAPPSGPIVAPPSAGGPTMSAPVVDPMNGGVSATRPGAAPVTPGAIPPLGSSAGGAAPTMSGAPPDPMNGPKAPTGIPPLGGGVTQPIKPPPLGPVGTGQPIQPGARRPTDIGVAKPIGGGRGRPGSTDQIPKPTAGPTDIGIAKPIGASPGAPASGNGPKLLTAEGPKPVFNPKTGNWHTPGAGENRTRRNGKPKPRPIY